MHGGRSNDSCSSGQLHQEQILTDPPLPRLSRPILSERRALCQHHASASRRPRGMFVLYRKARPVYSQPPVLSQMPRLSPPSARTSSSDKCCRHLWRADRCLDLRSPSRDSHLRTSTLPWITHILQSSFRRMAGGSRLERWVRHLQCPAPTRLQKLMPFIHVVTMWCLLAYFALCMELRVQRDVGVNLEGSGLRRRVGRDASNARR